MKEKAKELAEKYFRDGFLGIDPYYLKPDDIVFEIAFELNLEHLLDDSDCWLWDVSEQAYDEFWAKYPNGVVR